MFPYEKLEVYRKAYETNRKVYRLLKEKSKIPQYAKTQLGRACMSIMLNIAEGSGKYSNKDRRHFYVIARGSVFECSSLICFLNDEHELEENLKEEIYSSFDEISRMLYVMIKNLT